jgi:hypothetical protein
MLADKLFDGMDDVTTKNGRLLKEVLHAHAQKA